MAIEKDLNTPPYFDDYDQEKNYHQVLFRPSTAIQARELTQLQTILQNQIERFGNHVFKDGTIVQGCAITYYPNTHYISVSDNFNTNTAAFVTDYDQTFLVTNSQDSNTAVRATIKIAKDGVQVSAPETNRLYLNYIFTGTNSSNNDVDVFAPGDTLYFYNSNQGKFATLDSDNLVDTIETLQSNSSFQSNGYAYCIGVSDGIIFQKGFFAKVSPQIITVTDFSTNVAGYVVGFDTTETIITELNDSSLNDNALGYSNENAPGAHRLKLTPTLVSKLRTDSANNKTFFAIVEFDSNEPTEQNDDPQYNVVQQQFSRRTYEESGDYVIKPFQIETRTNSSNTQSFDYEVSTGIAYVRGNRIEKIGSTRVEAPRAITTEVAQNQIVTGNYGNYVICDEFLGAFDTEQLSEVTLYDQPQNAISDQEGTSSSPSGSIVGYANVRAVVHETGTKGLPQTQYYVYLFNIRMNSGKSFSADVKSLYMTGSLGSAKADVVIENDLAVLKESTKASVAFNTGLSAIKRLTNNTGIGDTTYTYTQIKSGTLGTGGTVTITIDTAGPGTSTESLTQTTGSTVTGSSLDLYNVYLSQNAYTANLTGTIAISSGNVVIVGTGTAFTTQLTANSNIRIYANSTQTYVRRVVSIANSTQLTIDSSIAQTNTSSAFGKYYVTGTPLPLSSVLINSNTSFTANLNATVDSGTQTVYCQYPVFRNQATAIPKVVNKNVFVKIDCSNNVSSNSGPWSLGIADVHKIRHVYVGTTYANTNTDRLSWFTLDSGQRDEFYDHGRLVIKPEYASQINTTAKFLVELDYFKANTTAAVGFFSVESYPIDDANTANTNAIQTIEIPQYNGNELRNLIDFRPVKANTANGSTTIADATTNPQINTTSFSISGTGQYLIAPDTNFQADFEYYLPRYDLVTIDPNGTLGVVKGVPSTFPSRPFVENDQSVIAECFVPAYPTPTKREFDQYKTLQSTTINLKQNRRYTMKDIGALEERIKRVEYYTVLNAVEQQAKDLTIPDAQGLNRFKNGIFADPFNSHNIGNVQDFEYKIAIDPKETVARPFFDKHDIDFQYVSSNSTNVTRTGSLVSLNYTSEQYIKQRFATKYRNACESVWQWNGLLDLYPSYDFFRDEDVVPNVNVNLDLSAPWEQFAQSPWGTIFGDWRDVQSTSDETSSGPRNSRVGGLASATTTTTTTQERIVSSLQVNTLQQNIDLGSYVKDISIQPYIRSRLVAFVAYNMKPNTTLHAFFDDVNVDQYCAPGELSMLAGFEEGREDKKVIQTGAFGSSLVSDSTGFVCGLFKIPAETFRTGDRLFQLSNVDNLVTGGSARITNGKATFTADNISVTKSSTTINVRQPQLTSSPTTQRRQVVTSETSVWWEAGDDPIAQSFRIEGLPALISGIFLTKVGVYFQAKDSSLGCSVLITEMDNGFPDMSRIIGKGYLPASSISVSSTGQTETQFTLENPVYLLTNTDYAFVVQPDGNSPEYTVWIGETGEFDVYTNEQVFSNPYSGILFVSANKKTWTAFQKEDIKFNLYRAKFSPLSGTAVFKNESDEYITIDGFTKANSSLSVEIGDIVYCVNSSANTANVSNLVSYTLTSGVSGRVQYINEADGIIWLDSSTANTTAKFSNSTNPTIAIYRSPDVSDTSNIQQSTLVAYGNVVTVDNLNYHAVAPKFGTLQPSRTNLQYQFKGTSLTNVIDTSFTSVDNNYEYEYNDNSRHAMSLSNEIQSLSSQKSSIFNVTLESQSEYVSPVINLSKKTMLFIENKINNDVTNEHTRYGNSVTKYISKRIVLADGQEAEDLRVYLTGYRPSDTDIKIYAKFYNNQDPQPFDDKVWTLLQYDNGGDLVYSSPGDRSNFIEYQFSVPTTNAVPYAAFANTNVDTYNPLAGTITIANNSTTITGTGTAFDTALTVGSVVRVQSGDYFAIRTVTSIANSTQLTVDNGLVAANSAALFYVFSQDGNDGIVEYRNSNGSRFIGYKEVALKIVLLSSNPIKVPRLNDVRAICLQV